MARWAAIIGARGTGKTAYAREIVDRLRVRGVRVGGFLQQAVDDELGRRSYDLRRLSREEKLTLARTSTGQEVSGQTSFCSFSFVNDAFAVARRWIDEDAACSDVLFLDEVSKLEAGGQGHHDAVRAALSLDERKVVVLCVRADQLFYVVERFELEDDAVGVLQIPGERSDVEAFVDAVAARR